MLDQFIRDTEGKYIDIDGAYGSQCWDYSGYYAKVVCGCPSFPSGNGTAIGVFKNFLNPLPQYFDKVVNNLNDPNQYPPIGAIVFWTYNHTGVVIGSNSRTMTTLEQNGANDPNQDGIADGVVYRITRGYDSVAGWFVPKINVNGGSSDMAEKINENTSKILQHAIIARNGLRGRAYALDGSTGLPWVGGDLTNEFINNVFKSPEAVQWRDSNDPASVNDINTRLDSIPNLQARVTTAENKATELNNLLGTKTTEIERLTKENETLKSQVGSTTKWETFKSLIRELFNFNK